MTYRNTHKKKKALEHDYRNTTEKIIETLLEQYTEKALKHYYSNTTDKENP